MSRGQFLFIKKLPDVHSSGLQFVYPPGKWKSLQEPFWLVTSVWCYLTVDCQNYIFESWFNVYAIFKLRRHIKIFFSAPRISYLLLTGQLASEAAFIASRFSIAVHILWLFLYWFLCVMLPSTFNVFSEGANNLVVCMNVKSDCGFPISRKVLILLMILFFKYCNIYYWQGLVVIFYSV
jgi:hypothetical protein